MTEPLHDDLVAISQWVDPVTVPDIEMLDAHVVQSDEPSERFPWQRMLVAAAAVLVVIAGVWVVTRRDDADPFQPTPGDSGWVETAPSPLQPRNEAQAVFVGHEFVVFGGTPQPSCPLCDYAFYGETLRDAAAYDPATDTWRTIAPLPDDASHVGQSAVVGAFVYWLSVRDPNTNASGIDATLFRYDVTTDKWTNMPLPADMPNAPRLTAVGDALLLYPSSDEVGAFDDWIWNETGSDHGFASEPKAWTQLPADPFPQSYDRQYVDGGDSFLLFSRSIASVSSAEPPVVQTASLFSGSWQVMSAGDQLAVPVVGDGHGSAYAPFGGGADGGEINNWGRTVPNGGSYDLETDSWSTLPSPVPEDLNGVLFGDTTSFLGGVRGSVLDAATGGYLKIPTLPDGLSDGFGQATAGWGMVLFTFGGTTAGIGVDSSGADVPDQSNGVHNRAFVWTTGEAGLPGPSTTAGSTVTDPTITDSQSTSTVPVDSQAALDAAITQLGIDRSAAPDGAFDLGSGRFCGYETPTFIGPSTENAAGRECFAAALDANTSAIFVSQLSTTEGDPIAHVFVTAGGADHLYVDSTRDKFGSGKWEQFECALVPAAGQVPFVCEDNVGQTSDPQSTLAQLATDALCSAAIDLLETNTLSDTPKLIADLRALSTDGLPSDVLTNFTVAVDALESDFDGNRTTLDGWDSGALSSFLTDTCGRGEIGTYYVTP